jgi:hypothetical protein
VSPVPVAGAGEASAYERAEQRLGVGDFDEAASFFEDGAREVGCDSDAWERAVTVRLALDEQGEAAADIDRFARSCGAQEPGRVARLYIQVAENRVSRDAWRDVARAAAAAMPWSERAGSTSLKLVARVRLGTALWRLNERPRALVQLNAAVAEATRKGATLADPQEEEALAEARYWLAEDVFEARRPVFLPPHRVDSRSGSGLISYDLRELLLVRQWDDAMKAEAAFLRVYGVRVEWRHCSNMRPAPANSVDCGDGPGTLAHLDSGDRPERFVLSEDPLAETWKGTPPSARWAIESAVAIATAWREVAATVDTLTLRATPADDKPLTWEEIRNCWDCGIPDPRVEIVHDRIHDALRTCMRLIKQSRVLDKINVCAQRYWSTYPFEGRDLADDLFPPVVNVTWPVDFLAVPFAPLPIASSRL